VGRSVIAALETLIRGAQELARIHARVLTLRVHT
jgi:hypothetical protein